ncbi:MAG: histidine kinase dimerization/phospho-acceptor domain-containing protein, partial [Chitinophagaceae bacterium]
MSFYDEHLSKDSALQHLPVNDTFFINTVRTRIKKDLDSAFSKNDVPLDYVFAVGKLKPDKDSHPAVTNPFNSWSGNNLIWSSNPRYNDGLMITKLRLASFDPKGFHRYYVKIYFPGKAHYIIKELLPLIVVTVATLVALFICFLTLLTTIRKQRQLAVIKSDFINNMTHELKTPVFTISVAAKMLSAQPSVQENKKQLSYVISIQEETRRLTLLVDKVLQSSALKRGVLSA